MLRERNVVKEHNLGTTEERIKSLQNLASFFKTERRTVAETSMSLNILGKVSSFSKRMCPKLFGILGSNFHR